MQKRGWVKEAVAGILLGILLSAMLPRAASADIVTEFGFGYKLPTTSVVLVPECHEIVPIGRDGRPVRNRKSASCGGDNPAFIGWPVAYEWDNCMIKAMKCRVGWFHYSNWFDGGTDRETHMDLAAFSFTFNWTEWRRNKR